jgi:hypothetical protein
MSRSFSPSPDGDRVARCCVLAVLCVVGSSSHVAAQAAGQEWTTATVDWLATHRLTYEIEFEPRAQIVVHAGQPTFSDLHTVPQVKYVVFPWMDVLAETDVGIKNQSDEINEVDVMPRVGVDLHILSRLLQERDAGSGADRETHPKQRLDVHTLVRLEDQITASRTGSASASSSWHIRDRLAAAYPLNRPKTTANGAVYLTSDAEFFEPVGASSGEGFVDQIRWRTGVGYRRSFAWRFETLYQLTAERNDTSGVMAVHSHTIDVRLKRVF